MENVASDQIDVLIVGSINMDLVVRAGRVPLAGQTVIGSSFITTPGGKGANQAVAVARLGGRCRFIGDIGADPFGEKLLTNMKHEGIQCDDVLVSPEAPTGVAMILVDAKGENYIVVAPGANWLVTPDDVFAREEAFKKSTVVLLQLELPLPTVRACIDLARRHGCKVILDPAPAPAPSNLCDEICKVDIITPNATEAEVLTGRSATDERGDKLVASDLIARGAKAAVLKLGARGSLVVMADGHFYTVPPIKVDVVDTTAAGDAFAGALAVAVAQGQNMHQAAKFANAAGALACTRFGAQMAMPTLNEVKSLMVRWAESGKS